MEKFGYNKSQWRDGRRRSFRTARNPRGIGLIAITNHYEIRQEMLHLYNTGPSQSISERTLRRGLHGLEIFNRVSSKCSKLTTTQKIV
ncbi:hypothetical protein TNCT_309901 [Trichonephila clavata]|uniref:Uncharacterized protein n=1 Tax=Trichonephila clavata TaxID=2740835 RepID=A0A8X6GNC2_TRICU|nr:hypothetical protein TNCT_309901 [Trichonephila clavata]